MTNRIGGCLPRHASCLIYAPFHMVLGLPRWLSCKESSCSAGDAGWIPESERYPGGGHDNALQYSCLEHPLDRGACLAAVHGVEESDTTEATEHTLTYIRSSLTGMKSDGARDALRASESRVWKGAGVGFSPGRG